MSFFKPNIKKMQKNKDFRGLIKALGHKNIQIRNDTTKALIEIGNPVVENLIPCLNYENTEVRNASAKILGAIGDLKAVEPLTSILNDKDKNVSRSAVEALEKMSIKSRNCSKCKKLTTSIKEFNEKEWEIFIPLENYKRENSQLLCLCNDCIDEAKSFEKSILKLIKKNESLKKLFFWLKNHEGMKIIVNYDNTDAESFETEMSESIEWIITKPKRFRNSKIMWDFVFKKRHSNILQIDFDNPTYYESEVKGKTLIFKKGFSDCINERTGDREGIGYARNIDEVDGWEIYRFISKEKMERTIAVQQEKVMSKKGKKCSFCEEMKANFRKFIEEDWEFYVPESTYEMNGEQLFYLCDDCFNEALSFEKKARKLIEKDENFKKLFNWFKKHEGQKIMVKYEDPDGESRDDYWWVSRQVRSFGNPIAWDISEKIHVEINWDDPAYHETILEVETLIYKQGVYLKEYDYDIEVLSGYYWSGAKNREEAASWKTYKFIHPKK